MPVSPPTHRARAPGKVHGQIHNRQARRALHTDSKAWKAIRRRILARDLYLCRRCGKYGDQVDHVDGDSHNNDEGNLQTLCRHCHSRKTAAEVGRVSRLPTLKYPPVCPVTVVAGPPGSGKTTYARANAGSRDLVIDLDDIKHELTGKNPHATPDDRGLMLKAMAERNERLMKLSRAKGVERCWFVVTAPGLAERRHWARQLGADVVVLEVGAEECLRRIAADAARQDVPASFWERIVGDWWARYTADGPGAEKVVRPASIAAPARS